MYTCSKCEKDYDFSEENNKKIPELHIIQCPHCECKKHYIGGEDAPHYGENAIEIYGGHLKEGEGIDLEVIKGKMVN